MKSLITLGSLMICVSLIFFTSCSSTSESLDASQEILINVPKEVADDTVALQTYMNKIDYTFSIICNKLRSKEYAEKRMNNRLYVYMKKDDPGLLVEVAKARFISSDVPVFAVKVSRRKADTENIEENRNVVREMYDKICGWVKL